MSRGYSVEPRCADNIAHVALVVRRHSPAYAEGCGVTRPPRIARPFECRIWPLRLMHDADGTLLIGCYDACPALSPAVQESLHAFATGDLLPRLLQFAKDNPAAIRPLDPAYHIVWRAPSKSPVSA